MKKILEHLQQLRAIQRHKRHPLIHKIHRQHRLSHKTMFYIKEYGPHANVPKTIIKESIKILLLASFISSLGGLALESVKPLFLSIFPMIILFPALNDMVGDYGTIISSRLSTMLHEGKVKPRWWKTPELKVLFLQILLIAVLTSLLSSCIALIISQMYHHDFSIVVAIKIFFIGILDTLILVAILFIVSVLAGLYFYKKGEDPNNFLIPITTAIADFGNMFILIFLILLLF